MSNSLKSLTDTAKEVAWHRLELPNTCFDIYDSSIFAIPDMDLKIEIMQWLGQELSNNTWQLERNNVYDTEGYESGNRVTSILFKNKEDAVYFATTWF